MTFSDYKIPVSGYLFLTGLIFLICVYPSELIAEDLTIERPICAVLPFEALYGLEEDQAELVTESFIQAISSIDRLKLADREAIYKNLDAHTLEKLSIMERALQLGRLLKVHKTIAGTVESEKGIYVVHTILMDIATGEIEGEITSYSDEDFSHMLSKIPDENARELMMKLELSPQYKKIGNQEKLLLEQEKPRLNGKSPWKANVWSGVGYWSGDVTYRIGNTVKLPDGSEFDYWFPLSELEWPINVVMASVGGDVTYAETIEARGAFSISVNDPTDKMKDSDWEYPGIKTIYSESDAELNAWSVDAGIRWWFLGKQKENFTWGLGVGGGYLYQYMDWAASNLDQWYPTEPWIPHDRVSGVVGKYKASLHMPYPEVSGKIGLGGFSLEVSFGYAPYVAVNDEDDHVLRYIKANTDATGTGWKLGGVARYDFEFGLFLAGRVDVLDFETDGSEKNYIYAGPDQGYSWEIYHEITSKQISGILTVGYQF